MWFKRTYAALSELLTSAFKISAKEVFAENVILYSYSFHILNYGNNSIDNIFPNWYLFVKCLNDFAVILQLRFGETVFSLE